MCLRDDLITNDFQTISKNFSNYLVFNVAKIDWSVITTSLRISNFGDKDNICIIPLLNAASIVENVQTVTSSIHTHYIPIFLEEESREAIGTQGFGWEHLGYCAFYFRF